MNNSKGAILAITLGFMGLCTVLGLGALQLATGLGQSSINSTIRTQAFWVAEGGAVQAKEAIKAKIRTTLPNALRSTATATVTSNCSTYLSAQTPLNLLSDYGGFTSGSGKVTLAVPSTIPLDLGSGRQGTYNATVTVMPDTTHTPNPTQNATTFTFYYKYSINSPGLVVNSGVTRTVNLGDGVFSVSVQKENFARYGLFTGSQDLSGSPIWFISSTHYTGPIHTNDRFNFAGIPAGIFDGLVTQAQQTARFYNGGSYLLLDCDQNPCADSGLVSASAWRSTTTYATGTYVTSNSVTYRSLQNGNRNRQPNTQPAYWRAQFQSWNNTVNYGVGDYVVYASATYGCIQSNTNKQPDTQTAYWEDPYTDDPMFNQGFLRGQAVINLPTDGTTEASLKTEALGPAWNSAANYVVDDVISYNSEVYRSIKSGINKQPNTQTTYWSTSNGVYVPNAAGSVTGAIYVKGDACMTISVSGSNPVYAIRSGGSPSASSSCQGGTLTTVTINYSANTTTVAGTTTNTYSGIPDGMTQTGGTLIYVKGQVTGFSGTVQRDTNLTVSAENDFVITGHAQYQDDPRTIPNAQNLLGIISWTGDIRVGTTAPNDLIIQGVLMAPQGMGLYVDNYTSGSLRGTIRLLGGVIADVYGVVGSFNAQGLTSGFARDFSYDTRMSNGKEPYYYPYTGKYIATDNGGSEIGLDADLPWQEM